MTVHTVFFLKKKQFTSCHCSELTYREVYYRGIHVQNSKCDKTEKYV